MTDDTLVTHLAEHPKMSGILYATMLLRLRTRTPAGRSTAYAGP